MADITVGQFFILAVGFSITNLICFRVPLLGLLVSISHACFWLYGAYLLVRWMMVGAWSWFSMNFGDILIGALKWGALFVVGFCVVGFVANAVIKKGQGT